MTNTPEVGGGSLRRLAAFTTTPQGGNPAGVWIGAALPDRPTMQRIAAELGDSETVFLAPGFGARRKARYFSPRAEVPFCGHATIAAGVALGDECGDGLYELETSVGLVPVEVRAVGSVRVASLTSVEPRSEPASDALVSKALEALGWTRAELDDALPPARAFAGAWHLILAAGTRTRLARLGYDFAALEALMLREDLTTLQLVWRESPTLFHARNPFPVGGVVEDPATGAAAAALGGYLRQRRRLAVPGSFTILQGEDMGRPSRIEVHVPARGGVTVSGSAVRI